MAVTITTKFFADSAYGGDDTWKNLSKVVFTSPNLDSPSAAGTRSHILPGQLDLGTWYEESSNMYRIFDRQIASLEEYEYGTGSTTVSGFYIYNAVKFELTSGENYDNRLTAWDDVTHSSTDNYLIDNEMVKVSAVGFNYTIGGGTEQDPDTYTEVYAPVYNWTLKGNTTVSGQGDAYYGDFDMVYRTPSDTYGDILMFRPWLYNINPSVPYGVHDFVITLHYTYT
jgi:hypothetical protein